jgi:hypothetical protein
MSNLFNLNRLIPDYTINEGSNRIPTPITLPPKVNPQQVITVEQVNDSFKEYKKSTMYISFLETQINNNISLIQQFGYNNVLRPLFEKMFYSPGDYCWIISLPTNINDATNEFQYSTKFGFLQGQKVTQIKNVLPNLKKNALDILNYYYDVKNKNKNRNYKLSVHNFDNGQKLYMNLFMPDVRNPTQMIVCGSAIHLNNCIVNPIPTVYLNFVNIIQQIINNIGNTDIFEYGPNFEVLKCISSTTHPSWNGQLISNCFIPGSNENFPLTIKDIVNKINSYPSLRENQKCIITYEKNNEYWISVVDIIGNNQFVQRSINISSHFKFENDFSDKIVTGNFKVNGYKKNTIMNVDPSTKITCFNEKVGINQTPFEVNAILDIDTNSQQQITMINTTIKNSFISLYKQISNTILGDVTVFRCPIQMNIRQNNITMIHQPITLNNSSILKIQNIVHELYYNNINQTYSFIEILQDNSNKYLGVMNGIISNNQITFYAKLTNINYILNDLSLAPRFYEFITQCSGEVRSMNYAVSLLKQPDIILSLQSENNNTFSNAITNHVIPRYEQFYCVSLEDDTFLFHEQNPHWNGKKIKELYIGDYSISTIIDLLSSSYISTYNTISLQTTLLDYMWIDGLRNVFIHKMSINNKPCMLCIELKSNNYLVSSIHCRGDSSLSGNFTIQDESENVIFAVDNYNKNIKNMYNVGIGTPIPESPLDIQDTGVDDIIHLINDVSSESYTNTLIEQLKNTNMNDSQSVHLLFNDIPQTNNSYYAILKFPDNTDLNVTWIYNWLFPLWGYKSLSQLLNDPNEIHNIQLLNTAKSIFKELYSSFLFDGCMRVCQFVWINGIKRAGYVFFKNNMDGLLYALGIGKNTQSYGLKMNTNKNIQNHFDSKTAYNYYLQSIVYRITTPTIQTNMSMLDTIISKSQQTYPLLTYTVYTIDPIIEETRVRTFSFSTNQEITNKIIRTMKFNERTKYLNYVYNYNKYYSTLTTGYGMIAFEDTDNNFISKFYKHENNIYSVEFCIEDYLNPTMDVKGDSRIQGNLVVFDKYNKHQYTTIDPNNKYIGINTDDRFIFYNTDYVTTEQEGNKQLAKHHVYITNNTYPNLACERINDTTNPYTSYSAATMKRHSNTDTFMDMKLNTNPQTNGVGKNMYGVDISFELSNNKKTTQEIGNIIMGIDKLENGLVKAGFSVRVNDANLSYRNILHVNNDSCLFVNSIDVQGNKIRVDSNKHLSLPPSNKLSTTIHNRETLITHYPFSLQNNTPVPITNVYTISLPVLLEVHVISIQFSMEYTEYTLNHDLAYNVDHCTSYFFKSHFTYDSTWITAGKGIPNMPYHPKIYSCEESANVSTTTFTLDYDDNTIKLNITLPPDIYIVATSTIKLGQIYPRNNTLYDDFEFSIEKTS